MPVAPDGSAPEDRIELMAPGAEDTGPAPEALRRTPTIAPGVVTAAALALIGVVALTWFGPGGGPTGDSPPPTTASAPAVASDDPVTVDADPPATTAARQGDQAAAPAPGIGRGSVADVGQPPPPFDPALPELPGAISGFDGAGGLIVIRRQEAGPIGVDAGLVADGEEPVLSVAIAGSRPVGFAVPLVLEGSTISALPDGGQPGPAVDLRDLGAGGEALFVSHADGSQTATLVSLDGMTTQEDAEWYWELPGSQPQVLGSWKGRLLVHQAARTWQLALPGGREPDAPVLVADGPVMSFDGRHLVRQECAGPASCTLVVGTPDQPDGDRVTAPPSPSVPGLRGQWTGAVAVSPDGDWLAGVVRFGSETVPVLVRLATGRVAVLEDLVGPDAPLVWSPDSRWLAYPIGGDLMVREAGTGRAFPITVNRHLQVLFWA